MSFLRIRFPQLYRVAAWVAMLAVLMPLLASLAPMPVARAYTQNVVRVCGGDQGDSGKAGDKDSSGKLPSCPICQSLSLLANGFVPPVLIVLLALAVAGMALSPRRYNAILSFEMIPQARPRAPPLFV